jgi:hypothetical protein
MQLTNQSQHLISIFEKEMKYTHHTKATNTILTQFYNDIYAAHSYLVQYNGLIYKTTLTPIRNPGQIPRPAVLSSKYFHADIQSHINNFSKTEIKYTFKMFARQITIIFVVEETNPNLQLYNKHVESMILWLHVLNKYASPRCSNTLVVYLYFTSLEKQLPNSNSTVLNELHVNTAFTTTCPSDSEIVIYRKEEWFKVFIHETFHNYGLDFSNMSMRECTNHILSLFPVKSDVNLFEAYTEFWAEIMNVLLFSFSHITVKSNLKDFLHNAEYLINNERTYSYFQLVKTLDFMGLNYTDLYTQSKKSDTLRKTNYNENTNVLSYYVIKTILLSNHQTFLGWCKSNNKTILQFTHTRENLTSFCKYIEKHYKTAKMLEGVENAAKFMKKHPRNRFLHTNMRMSISEGEPIHFS